MSGGQRARDDGPRDRLGILAVPEKGPVKPGLLQVHFSRAMIQFHDRGIVRFGGAEDRGVSDVPYAGSGGGVDRVLVLSDPGADTGGAARERDAQ
jgi:hypothetical protein